MRPADTRHPTADQLFCARMAATPPRGLLGLSADY